MTGKPGRILTPEQTARLALVNTIEREQMIAFIVKGLRETMKTGGRGKAGGAGPHTFYSRPICRQC